MSVLNDEGTHPWPVTVGVPVQRVSTSEQLRFAPLSVVPLAQTSALDRTMDTVSLQVTPPNPYMAPPRLAVAADPVATPRGRRARRPAPLLLRAFVLGLLVIVVLSNLALGALELRPSWLAAVKGELHQKPAAAASVRHAGSLRFGVVTTGANAVTYRVPVASYTISLSIDHPCWVVVKSPLDSTKPVLATVLRPSDAAPIPISGSSSVVVSAATKAITLTDKGKVVGVVTSPILGTTYTFLPPNAH